MLVSIFKSLNKVNKSNCWWKLSIFKKRTTRHRDDRDYTLSNNKM